MTYYVRVIALFALLCGWSHTYAQTKYTISGYVSDARTGERLIGVHVSETGTGQVVTTNTFGFYALNTRASVVALQTSYLGYSSQKVYISLHKDTLINLQLVPKALQLAEVEVNISNEYLAAPEMGTITLRPNEIKSIPALMGEVDVLKAAQLMPGVSAGREGSTDLLVRGGSPDQNLLLLDGVPVYNATHVLGFISVFNTDALRQVNVVKGGFPARYGGRLSSVVDIQMKEGNSQQFSGEGSIGILSSKLLLEGPMGSENTTFLISGRRTYFDAFAVMAQAFAGEKISTYNFYDFTGKVSRRFSDKDRLFISLYSGRDHFINNFSSGNDEGAFKLKWGNQTGALRWNHLFGSKLFSNVTLTFSDYKYRVRAETQSTLADSLYSSSSRVTYESKIRDWGARVDFDYQLAPRHTLRFGGNLVQHTFNPNAVSYRAVEADSVTNDSTYNSVNIRAIENFIYLEDEITITPRLKANVGVHASSFHVRGKDYFSFQPRLSLSQLIGEQSSVKASFSSMAQYLHLLSNSGVGLPTDIWVPATDRIAPQRSWIASAGYFRNLREGQFEASAELYYKKMNRVIEFTEGTDFLKDGPETDLLQEANTDWEDRVSVGKGTAYGAEFLLCKKRGRTTGWIGYTLAWANRQFSEINEGKPFPYIYDRRHDLSIVLNHQLSKRISVNGVWVYNSGQRATLPEASYLPYTDNRQADPNTISYVNMVDYINNRNNYKLPAYHRLDLGISFLKLKAKSEREWNISVYNAYNRKNVYTVFLSSNRQSLSEDNVNANKRYLNRLTLFTIIPSISYRYKF